MNTVQSAARSLRHVTHLGDETVHYSIQAPSTSFRVWLEDAPVCSPLSAYQIIHCGIVRAFPPYRFVRPNAIATELLVCLSGSGHFLLDGKWQEFGPRMAALMPQSSLAGYCADAPGPWELLWVCYEHRPGQAPLTVARSPVLASYDGVPLRHAIQGLRHECLSSRDAVHMESWAELIHKLVLRFARPGHEGDRFARLWEVVARTLNKDWTLDELARESGSCREALRRRCQTELGRSPMQYLTFLRQQRARTLLTSTMEKVESIAASVGYDDAYAFSMMFKRWTGVSPSEFRMRLQPQVGRNLPGSLMTLHS